MTALWSSTAFAGLKPRPRLTMSEWADAHRVVAAGTSPEPGPFRTPRTPYLREPMDAISDPRVERAVLMWASQLAKSELLLNAIGYHAHQDPAAMLLVQPTEGMLKSFMKERVEPTFRESPALAGLLHEGKRDKGNTIVLKQFPGGYLAGAWASSPAVLASRPIRVLLLDEVDRFPVELAKEGDPIELAIQRTSNFHNRKVVIVSTPTDETSRISKYYKDSDQSRLWVPCLRCGAFQVLTWERIVYKGADGADNLRDVHYRCEHCDGRIEERDKPEMLRACEWRPDFPGHVYRGFYLDALVSPWVRWHTLAAQWIQANRTKDVKGLRTFWNLRLARVWEHRDKPITTESLDPHRESYEAPVPDGVLALTCGVDVQHNRIELEILGWGKDKESWGVEYHAIAGDTSTPGPWKKLDELLARTWERADGTSLGLWCTCIDSGDGGRTDEVYHFCRDRLARNIFAIKGMPGQGRPVAGKPTLNKLRAPLYPVGSDTGKDIVYSRLEIADHGPGYCHFPKGAGYDAEYFRGLLSEIPHKKTKGGRDVMTWKQVYSRNEPLDCRVYATAALEIANPPLDRLAAEREKGAPVIAAPQAPPPRRRVISRGIQ